MILFRSVEIPFLFHLLMIEKINRSTCLDDKSEVKLITNWLGANKLGLNDDKTKKSDI